MLIKTVINLRAMVGAKTLEQIGFLGFDIDGTIIDTDMSTPGSAKYKESSLIVKEFTGVDPEPNSFNKFYANLIARTAGVPSEQASILFAELMHQYFNVQVPNLENFIAYRSKLRKKTYATLAEFIGNGSLHSGHWLSSLPASLQEKAYIVTSTKRDVVQLLDENEQLRIRGKPFSDFFGGRIVYGDQVLGTGEVIERNKPDPESYNKALALAVPGITSRGYVGIAFEDSKNGVMAAHTARYGSGRLYVVGIETTLSGKELRNDGADDSYPALYTIDLEELCEHYLSG